MFDWNGSVVAKVRDEENSVTTVSSNGHANPVRECGYELQDASSLCNHFRPGYFFKKEYCCRICLAVFASSCAWSAHVRMHGNNGPFVCLECDQELGSAEKRGRHLLIHYADRCDTPAWICPVCLKYYRRPQLAFAFDRHCQQKHWGERAALPVLYYLCGIVNCSWKTSAREDLKLHFEEHVKQKVHLTRCCSCGWLFQTEQDYFQPYRQQQHQQQL
ncbi:Zinc finger protein [Trichinella papuae]|uniref:Zinc finger protein n=1 Tax=Trichinella papuae TaxID=268474 RepID=A0A0V1MUP8_9BILA|nr:Zinc finger protein [Trichinella papuae]